MGARGGNLRIEFPTFVFLRKFGCGSTKTHQSQVTFLRFEQRWTDAFRIIVCLKSSQQLLCRQSAWSYVYKIFNTNAHQMETLSILCAHRNLTRGVGRFRELLRAVETRTTQNLRMVRVTADLIEEVIPHSLSLSLSLSYVLFRYSLQPWLVWLSGLSASLRTNGLPIRFPVRTHDWVSGQVPSRGCARGNHTLMFLSLSFSLPLSKNK